MAYTRIAAIGEITTNFNCSNKTIIQTMDNELLFCGNLTNVTCQKNDVIATLPSSFPKPTSEIAMNVLTTIPGNANYYYGFAILKPNGDIISSTNAGNATFYLNGQCIHLNEIYYSSTIGNNNQSTMTYPIGRL